VSIFNLAAPRKLNANGTLTPCHPQDTLSKSFSSQLPHRPKGDNTRA
jgi:hypothetical protein